MKTMRTLFLSALLLTLGAGCVPAPPPAQTVPLEGVAPHANEANCVKSGGAVAGGECECPENYAPDPAGFCLDAQGRPGGEMAPKS